jgi:hypothetical protein
VARRHVLAHRMSLMVPSLFGNELDSIQLQHAKATATPITLPPGMKPYWRYLCCRSLDLC